MPTALAEKLDELADRIASAQPVDEEQSERLDREVKSRLAALFGGMSPLEICFAYSDWLAHLAISPGRQLRLLQSVARKTALVGVFAVSSITDPDQEGPSGHLERRVSSERWKRWPFNVFAQSHQLFREVVNEASEGIAGMSPGHQRFVQLMNQQIIDALSPANFPLTNPDVLQTTLDERGKNLGRGMKHLVSDGLARMKGDKRNAQSSFVVGENVGITPGKVVYRNELFELIQYTPTTETVGAEPVLICPAWIMKYYILDLSPKNSMARYLVEQGKTVFMISWKNPGPEDADVGFEDYLQNGLMQAIEVVTTICPKKKVHATGYCIGGTLLLIAAASMARDDDERLKSVTLFAAQGDFTEAGGIAAFVSDSQLEFLDNVMWKEGVLASEKMGGAFGALHASDLIFGSRVDRYLLGNSASEIDLMAWNADGTRMPYRMHSEYLRKLFLRNELATNKFSVGGRPVSLGDIRAPMFVLGTETDHVAPWKSVYKLRHLTHTEFTFLLTSGGHNAGVVSGPEHPRRRYRLGHFSPGEKYQSPDAWFGETEVQPGSWWPAWSAWLDERTGSTRKPPGFGAPRAGYDLLGDAPGTYVFG